MEVGAAGETQAGACLPPFQQFKTLSVPADAQMHGAGRRRRIVSWIEERRSQLQVTDRELELQAAQDRKFVRRG